MELKLSIIPGGLKIGSPWVKTLPKGKIEGSAEGGNGRLWVLILSPRPRGI